MSSVFFSGFGVAAGLIMAIGAQNAHVLRQGLRREHVLLTVAVSAVCDAGLILLGMAGIGPWIASSATAMAVAKVGGGVFLLWYGARAARSAWVGHAQTMDTASSQALSRRQALAAAAGFSLLNPHAYLDTVVLIGAVGATQLEAARPVFTAGAIAASFSWFVLLGYGARLMAPLFRRPVAWRVLDSIVALTLWSIAASLLLR
ncbi:LysE/ArgO family amino acid transporter [Denitromonas sp.]|uniref:LysE/ArgO family amino acid transporter n=1 Tax=Denitromonas sp. TaxID=2734609 RepID=UPI002AFFA792|nr:LysE/ArgO family amino acid transporter [Denitromonas sp.]